MKRIEEESIKSDESSSILFWLLMIFTALFLFIVPFYRALFNGESFGFERPIYSTVLLSSIILLLLSCYIFFQWRMKRTNDLLTIAIWLLPLSYAISIINAASFHSAVNGLYIQVIYAVFFLLGALLARNKLGLSILTWIVLLSAYMLVLNGFLNWFGFANYQDAVFAGGRLSNVFQYPNTYAAVLIGLLVSNNYLFLRTRHLTGNLVHALMHVPILLSFFLTGSRGGLLILPLLVLIYMFFITLKEQLFVIVTLALTGAITLLILKKTINIRIDLEKGFNHSIAVQGTLWVVASAIGAAILLCLFKAYVYQDKFSKWNSEQDKWRQRLIIPVGLIVLTLLTSTLILKTPYLQGLLPSSVQQQIVSINSSDSSFVGRVDFYKDSFNLIRDYPVFGAGGGSWAALFTKYQSYPYQSRQAHSFYVQYMVEAGALGLIFFVFIFAATLFFFIRAFVKERNDRGLQNRLVFLFLPLAVLIHSAIDFDMSFVYLTALVFLSMGVLSSVGGKELSRSVVSFTKMKIIYPALICIVSIVLIVYSSRAIQANTQFSAIQRTQQSNFQQVNMQVDKALNLQSTNPQYTLEKLSLLRTAFEQTKDKRYYQEAMTLIADVKQKEPYSRPLFELETSFYTLNGEIERALNLTYTNAKKSPWDISLYERIIAFNFQLGQQKAGEDGANNKYWLKTVETYHQVLLKRSQLDTLVKETQKYESSKFVVTPQMALNVGQIFYYQKDYQQATSIFKNVITTNVKDEFIKSNLRWYLASLQKQNLTDEPMAILLYQFDSKERDRVQEIVNSQR